MLMLKVILILNQLCIELLNEIKHSSRGNVHGIDLIGNIILYHLCLNMISGIWALISNTQLVSPFFNHIFEYR